jgi:outer membrane biosynthesis protein TonB
MSDRPSVNFLVAFMASAIPVFGAAILFSLTVAGRELSRGPVELPKDVAQSSDHAKSTGQPRINPDSALLATLLEATDPDPIASATDQAETVTGPDAGYDSSSPTDAMDVASTSALMSPVSAGNASEEIEAIHPAEMVGDTPEGNAQSSVAEPPETVPQLAEAQKPASRSSKKPNGSAYGAGVYAALARHKPTAAERGSTTVTFQIGRGGVLSDVRVGQSSGNA